MITEDYCSYEVAKLLKEKGFNEKCVAYYSQCITPIKLTFGGRVNYNVSNKFKMLSPISAPTHQMAMKWLRETCDIVISIIPTIETDMIVREDYNYAIYKNKTVAYQSCSTSHEEAAEAALKYSLENLI